MQKDYGCGKEDWAFYRDDLGLWEVKLLEVIRGKVRREVEDEAKAKLSAYRKIHQEMEDAKGKEMSDKVKVSANKAGNILLTVDYDYPVEENEQIELTVDEATNLMSEIDIAIGAGKK